MLPAAACSCCILYLAGVEVGTCATLAPRAGQQDIDYALFPHACVCVRARLIPHARVSVCLSVRACACVRACVRACVLQEPTLEADDVFFNRVRHAVRPAPAPPEPARRAAAAARPALSRRPRRVWPGEDKGGW